MMTNVADYLDLPYTKVLRRDDDGDVVATIAELDGCMTHGSDESEALANLRDAQAAWIEAALATGQDIPVPQIEEDLPSGKFVVRLPKSLHQKLNRQAKRDDVSLNQVMIVAATDYVARSEVKAEHALGMTDAYAWLERRGERWDGRSTQRRSFREGPYFARVKGARVISGGAEPNHVHRTSRK